MKPRSHRAVTIAVIVLLAALCGGCASAYLDKSPGTVPEGGSVPVDSGVDDTYGPRLLWSEDGKTFLFVTWGSGSCPTEPTGVEGRANNVVDIGLKSGGMVCTADLEPTTYELAIPDGIDAGRDVELWVDGDVTAILPAFE